jgi:hypothetical protein
MSAAGVAETREGRRRATEARATLGQHVLFGRVKEAEE